MKPISIFLFLTHLFCFSCISSQCSAQCATASNIYAFTANGTSYEIVKEKKNWTTAAACAVARGGFLAHIETSTEAFALYDAIISAGITYTYTTVDDGGGIAYVWIGATDKFSEGNWIWAGNNTNTNNKFWTGQGAAGSNNGAAFGGKYNRWGGIRAGTRNEPDNYNFNQNAAAIALSGWPACAPTCIPYLGWSGEWNDIDIANALYYIIEYSNPLPVEIKNFTAQTQQKEVNLAWQTASEKDASHFDVERSRDGKTFSKIGKVKAIGQSAALVNYTFTDETPFIAVNYYRLRQVDRDGKEKVSNIVSTISQNRTKLYIYPNPVSSILIIDTEATGNFQILNLLGQSMINGTLSNRIDVSALPEGAYILKMGTEQTRFIKQ